MQWNADGDRRRDQRLQAAGSALVRACGQTFAARITDLSLGGASFVTAHGEGLGELAGTAAHVELRLDGARSGWFLAHARITRVDEQRRRLSMRFTVVPAELEDLLQDQMVGALEHDQSSCVVVIVDRSDVRRDAIGAALRRAGCRVVEARTPLETLHRLDDSTLRADVVAFADTESGHDGEQLRRFLHREYPGIETVVLRHRADHRAPR